MNTYTVSQFAEMIGYAVKTPQRWDREKRLVPLRTPTNRRMYTDEHLRLPRGMPHKDEHRDTIVYMRVSSQAQRSDLKNQRLALEQFCLARGIEVDQWVEEIGGGLNFKRLCRKRSPMIRAHKIRLNPTPEQETYLKKACGISRFVFNWGLARWKAAKEQGVVAYGPMAIKKDFNALKREEFPWVMEVTKNACEDGFRRLNAALANYFDSKSGKRKGEQVHFPGFKSKKKAKRSFTLDYQRFSVDGHWLHISKLDDPINMAEVLRFDGRLKWATISNTAGKWYASVQVEIEPVLPASDVKKPSVGVDMGIKTLATLSDGKQFENQKLLRSDLNRLRRLSRSLSRRKQGSNRWWRAKNKLARFHARIADQRGDVIHKMTTEIAQDYRIVIVEDLNVKGMLRNRRLALSLSDASLGEILRQLGYKAERRVKVGRFFASSKTCSDCGFINQALVLSDRQWICQGCGSLHERDWNAAKNIETEGLRLIAA